MAYGRAKDSSLKIASPLTGMGRPFVLSLLTLLLLDPNATVAQSGATLRTTSLCLPHDEL